MFLLHNAGKVKAHTRQSKSGKVSMVKEHASGRTSAPAHELHAAAAKGHDKVSRGHDVDRVVKKLKKKHKLSDEQASNLHSYLSKKKAGNLNKAHSDAQKEKIAKVMAEFKDGKLKSSDGSVVTDRQQAIAIALSEAERLSKGLEEFEALIKSTVKGHYSQRDGKRFFVKEHQDKRTKKQEDPKQQRQAKQGDGGEKKHGRLVAMAKEAKNAQDFVSNLKSGMGVMSANDVRAHIEDNSDGEHTLGDLSKKLEAGGDHWLRMKLSPETLSKLKVNGKAEHVPSDYDNDEAVVIVGDEVVEGKHRVLAAIRDGRKLSAFLPAETWYEKAAGATEGPQEKTSPEPKGKGSDKPAESENKSQLEGRGIPARLLEKCRRAEKGQGGEVELTKAETYIMLEKGVVGLVSAGKNPNFEKDMKPEEEKARYEQLRNDLVEMGLKFKSANGKYEGFEEDSFMVMATDTQREEMIELGKKYNQDSVIFSDANKNEMIFTTGDNEGKHFAGAGFNKMDGADDFFTEIKTKEGDLKFNLNFDWDNLKKSILRFLEPLMKGRVRGHYRQNKSGSKTFVKEHNKGQTKSIADVLHEREMAASNGSWHVGGGGSEPVLKDVYGNRWQSVWQPATGRKGWLNLEQDIVYPEKDEETGDFFSPHFHSNRQEWDRKESLVKAVKSGKLIKM